MNGFGLGRDVTVLVVGMCLKFFMTRGTCCYRYPLYRHNVQWMIKRDVAMNLCAACMYCSALCSVEINRRTVHCNYVCRYRNSSRRSAGLLVQLDVTDGRCVGVLTVSNGKYSGRSRDSSRMEWKVRVHFFLYLYLTVRGLCCVRVVY